MKRFNPLMMLKGFTLAELVLAAAILVFAFSALLAGFITCIFLNGSSRNLTTAVAHAQFVMEEIKNTSFDIIKSKVDNGDWDWNSLTIESKGLAVLPSEFIDTQAQGTNLLDVAVTVIWQDRVGRSRSAYLKTLFVQP